MAFEKRVYLPGRVLGRDVIGVDKEVWTRKRRERKGAAIAQEPILRGGSEFSVLGPAGCGDAGFDDGLAAFKGDVEDGPACALDS